MCEALVTSLNKASVNMDFIVSQSYDGASNMHGRYSGLQTRMLQYANRAQFLWCHAHVSSAFGAIMYRVVRFL